MPYFSVIIPLYNKEEFIAETLRSVLKQTFTDFEIIVTNDGSTDNSLHITKQTLHSFKAKIIVSQENRGLSATRNKAIKLAKGEIIALLDADDLWSNDFLESIYKLAIQFKDADVYGTDYIEKDTKNNRITNTKKTINHSFKNNAFLVEDFFTLNLGQPIICQSSLAFKKSVFYTISYNEKINYAEDIDFYINTFSKYKLAYLYQSKATITKNTKSQITSVGLDGKTTLNFNTYNSIAKNNIPLKKYINFYRYCFASEYRKSGNRKKFKLLKSEIDLSFLNFKQRFLIQSPRVIFSFITTLKAYFQKFGFKWNSY